MHAPDPFPWEQHRTLAQVVETEKLREAVRHHSEDRFPRRVLARLAELTAKEHAHNPPADGYP